MANLRSLGEFTDTGMRRVTTVVRKSTVDRTVEVKVAKGRITVSERETKPQETFGSLFNFFVSPPSPAFEFSADEARHLAELLVKAAVKIEMGAE